jgi:hypothetical protein
MAVQSQVAVAFTGRLHQLGRSFLLTACGLSLDPLGLAR